MRHYNIPIFIPHLGCPYDCIYCDQKKITAQSEAAGHHQILNIIDRHLATIIRPAEIEVAFFGGNFTALHHDLQASYLRLLQPYLEQKLIQGVRISTRPDCIDEHILNLLYSHGVKTIELGVQSLNNEVLHQTGRNYQAEDVEKSSILIKQAGFELGIQLMVGLPGDSYVRSMETTRKAVALAPQMVRIYPTLVIAGTKLEQMWQAGKYQALTLETAIPICRDMRLQFDRAQIPVIRMGLYPGEELRQEGTVKAGPFHPAFGELVEQAIFHEQALLAITLFRQRFGRQESLTIGINQRDLSKLLGKKRSNLESIQHSAGLQVLNVQTDQQLAKNEVSISRDSSPAEKTILTRTEFLHYLD